MALLLTGLALLGRTLAAVAGGLACREVVFDVSGTAQNRNISSLDFNDLDALTAAFSANSFDRFEVSGSEQIAGWFCQPSHRTAKVDKLQILNGLITTNREVWTAQGGTALNSPPLDPYKAETYSWVKYANEQGYAVLALDHLGTGKSSHPDPMDVVQAPYETELYHSLVTQIRTGVDSPLPRTYDHLVYVGASYGSVLGTNIAQSHPEDFEEIILTGFSKSVLPSLPGVAAQGAKPAKEVDPAKFGDLSPGYLTSPVEDTRTNSFFGDPSVVDFDPENAHLFFERKDVVATGQFVGSYVDTVEAPAYQGRVLVLTGENDQAFCGQGSSALSPNTSCGDLLKETGSLFPNAQYSWKSIPRTGHALILHKSALESLRVAHDFLAGATFD